ncbi:hypothetical protein HX776_03085 [Pseudomonas agarici]|uniref:hypothetical protein n=1 Tax=Pseudomonas agarici TaxID=46677 RepID=UPI000364F692|nr:hypothetical protein [Pseudomonas agarici]NWC07820.1 hypothetical protein [Pseudomonas agarici]
MEQTVARGLLASEKWNAGPPCGISHDILPPVKLRAPTQIQTLQHTAGHPDLTMQLRKGKNLFHIKERRSSILDDKTGNGQTNEGLSEREFY